jgi:hypothetical protein
MGCQKGPYGFLDVMKELLRTYFKPDNQPLIAFFCNNGVEDPVKLGFFLQEVFDIYFVAQRVVKEDGGGGVNESSKEFLKQVWRIQQQFFHQEFDMGAVTMKSGVHGVGGCVESGSSWLAVVCVSEYWC